MKLRFRIVRIADDRYVYGVEERGWFFWHRVLKSTSLSSADEYIRQRFKTKYDSTVGEIVKEYSEEEYLVEKLKGEI